MAVYGQVRHQKNNIWTEASDGDRPVHILPYDPKLHELFVILYFLSKIIMQVLGRSIYENSDRLR
jgi:hypothetical protein